MSILAKVRAWLFGTSTTHLSKPRCGPRSSKQRCVSSKPVEEGAAADPIHQKRSAPQSFRLRTKKPRVAGWRGGRQVDNSKIFAASAAKAKKRKREEAIAYLAKLKLKKAQKRTPTIINGKITKQRPAGPDMGGTDLCVLMLIIELPQVGPLL